MPAAALILIYLIASPPSSAPEHPAIFGTRYATTQPATRPTSQPSSAPATQFAPLVPVDTLYRVMKGKITKIDLDMRKLSFTWRNPHTIKDTPLTLKIKDGAVVQIDYRDVPLERIQPGEATSMVKIEQKPDGKGQQLMVTAIRQNEPVPRGLRTP